MTERIVIRVTYRDPLVAAGLASTLGRLTEFDVDIEPPGAVTSQRLRSAERTVTVADYESGVALAASHGSDRGNAPAILVLTSRQSEREIRHALECGVRGYLTAGCEFDELFSAVRALSKGLRHIGAQAARLLADSIAQEGLTSREEQVLRLLVEGHGNKTIGRLLSISTGTVKSHLKSIFSKLDAATRTEVATIAERRGLLCDLPGDECARLSTGEGREFLATPAGSRYRTEARAPSQSLA